MGQLGLSVQHQCELAFLFIAGPQGFAVYRDRDRRLHLSEVRLNRLHVICGVSPLRSSLA